MSESKLKKCLLPVLAALSVSAPARAAEPGIVVIDTDGNRQEIPLPALDRISFGASQLTVQTKNEADTRSYAYSAVDRIVLGKEVSAVAPVLSEGEVAVWPTVATSTVNVAGAAEGTVVNVYNADGSLAASATAGPSATAIDISAASRGVCVVRAGAHAVKIIKK